MNETTPIYTPDRFRIEYSAFYENSDSDSPESSREFLVGRIFTSINRIYSQKDERITHHDQDYRHTIRVLSVGAGRQILEHELYRHPQWQDVAANVEIITLDIATLRTSQLLSSEPHVVANGALLPFRSGIFDIVYSNMAIDFMPREAFCEVARVLQKDGMMLVNLHHPDLIEKARRSMVEICRKIHSINQKIRHGANSRKKDLYRDRLENALVEKRDAEFILNSIPDIIFHSQSEIYEYFQQHPVIHSSRISVEEHTNIASSNGWFYLEVEGMQLKNTL